MAAQTTVPEPAGFASVELLGLGTASSSGAELLAARSQGAYGEGVGDRAVPFGWKQLLSYASGSTEAACFWRCMESPPSKAEMIARATGPGGGVTMRG
jgi:hypothetical protein